MADYVPNDQERQLQSIHELKNSLNVCIQDYLDAEQTNIPEAYSVLLRTKEVLQAKIMAYNSKYYSNLLDTSEDQFKRAEAQVVNRVKKAQAARAAKAAQATKNGYQGVLRL